MIASLSIHEAAHAAVAYALGDRTAQKQGRLSLNPLVHVDPIGTVLMPLVQAFTGIPTIGWAKPVPVDVEQFRPEINRWRGLALVSAAGPLSNLLLAITAAAFLAVARPANGSSAFTVAFMAFLLNVGLFVFNLLPVPGLDGSRLLPSSLDGLQKRLQKYSGLVLLAIVAIPPVRDTLVGAPIRFVATKILTGFGVL